jgi:hypothetical protein
MSATANINEVISHSSMRLISFTDIKRYGCKRRNGRQLISAALMQKKCFQFSTQKSPNVGEMTTFKHHPH